MGSFPEHLISFSSLGPGSLYPSLLGCCSLCISHSENQGGRHTSPGGTQCRRKETLPLRRNSSTCPAAGHLLHPSSPWDAALAWADPHLSMTLRILPHPYALPLAFFPIIPQSGFRALSRSRVSRRPLLPSYTSSQRFLPDQPGCSLRAAPGLCCRLWFSESRGAPTEFAGHKVPTTAGSPLTRLPHPQSSNWPGLARELPASGGCQTHRGRIQLPRDVEGDQETAAGFLGGLRPCPPLQSWQCCHLAAVNLRVKRGSSWWLSRNTPDRY